MFWTTERKIRMPKPEEALPGRSETMRVPERHFVNGHPLQPPFPDGLETAMFGLGCFWGAERMFWQVDGVYTTAVGYAGGFTPNPTYEEVCTGLTGHNEVVLVVFDPKVVSDERLLKVFWEAHDPTQGMRQGNDVGTQYRSGIYTVGPAQKAAALASREASGVPAAPDSWAADEFQNAGTLDFGPPPIASRCSAAAPRRAISGSADASITRRRNACW